MQVISESDRRSTRNVRGRAFRPGNSTRMSVNLEIQAEELLSFEQDVRTRHGLGDGYQLTRQDLGTMVEQAIESALLGVQIDPAVSVRPDRDDRRPAIRSVGQHVSRLRLRPDGFLEEPG